MSDAARSSPFHPSHAAVFASGNDATNNDPVLPEGFADEPAVIVTATTRSDTRASYSNSSSGAVRALDPVSMTVDGGTSVAVMGPSGCGKSTLLGLLAGLALPTAGTVSIGGTSVSELDERRRVELRRRSVGMVYQADNLLPHLTVEENVGLQRSITGLDRREATTPLLARLGLDAHASRLPDQLSGGQRQRVAVARAIGHDPHIMLADEPTGALDPANARAVIELLTTANRALGATLVVVTHDPDIAEHLDRIVYLTRPDHTPEGVDAV